MCHNPDKEPDKTTLAFPPRSVPSMRHDRPTVRISIDHTPIEHIAVQAGSPRNQTPRFRMGNIVLCLPLFLQLGYELQFIKESRHKLFLTAETWNPDAQESIKFDRRVGFGKLYVVAGQGNTENSTDLAPVNRPRRHRTYSGQSGCNLLQTEESQHAVCQSGIFFRGPDSVVADVAPEGDIAELILVELRPEDLEEEFGHPTVEDGPPTPAPFPDRLPVLSSRSSSERPPLPRRPGG